MKTVENTIILAKCQILEDVARGYISVTVRDFSELHDYVDANEYGDIGAFFLDAKTEEEHEEGVGKANDVIQAIDAWIKGGGLREINDLAVLCAAALLRQAYQNTPRCQPADVLPTVDLKTIILDSAQQLRVDLSDAVHAAVDGEVRRWCEAWATTASS